jgi:Outer membrane protein beta-barrel domain
MNEKEANIDLLFRNGLKDYEVLPPSGVCDNILSSVRIKSRPFVFLRIAAAITVLTALSFLTYRWSRQVLVEHSSPVIALNVSIPGTVTSLPIGNLQKLQERKQNNGNNSSGILNEVENVVPFIGEVNTIPYDYPGQIKNIQEAKSMYFAKNELSNNLALPYLKISATNSVKLTYPVLQYSPENIIAKPGKRWSIAAMASPTYYSSFNSGSDALSKQLTSSEQPLVSYSGGVAFSYKLSKRFSIQSGLYYSSLGQKIDGINSFSGFQQYQSTKGGPNFVVITANGTVYTNNPDVFLSSQSANRVISAYSNDVFDPKKASLQPVNNSMDQNFSYLELPVVLKFKLIDKTIGINLLGGLSYNLLVNNSVYTTIDGSRYSIGKTEGLNPLTLSSSLGMGMEYNLSSKISLNLEPTFRYYLSPFSDATGSFIHPYSFGIFSGLSYKF